MLQFDQRHFIAGLIGTWVVGAGRYWDDPGASLLQHLGLGSVIYIFMLSLLLWLIVYPCKVAGWTYFRVLTFVSLTSFPAIFYAIPVEKFYSLEQANNINVWFLAIVAAWRVALLFFFLKRFTGLASIQIVVVTFLPICFIITALTILNLHRAVFDIMGGTRNATPHDSAYAILNGLTLLSAILFIPLIIGYFITIHSSRKRAQQTSASAAQVQSEM